MGEWDDFGYEEPEHPREPDAAELAATQALRAFFENNRPKVFFGNQIAVQQEDKYFHWIIHRAIRELVGEGLLHTEPRKLATGAEIKLVWHRTHRYYRRDAKAVVDLVDEYGSPAMCAAIGHHGEEMVLGGFARREFLLRGENTREFEGKVWTETGHNLDFIFEKEEERYGIEVKNTLSYMDEKEFDTKIRLCRHLAIRPVFVARMLPKTWINKLVGAGGFALILKYQLYPWTHSQLAKRVRIELDLPVDAPRRLAEGTMDRFAKWHLKNVNLRRNSQQDK